MNEPSKLPEVMRAEDFINDSHALDEAAFRARHGDDFLIHYGAVGDLNWPKQPQPTMVFKDETPFFSGTPLRTLKSDYLVYPIVSTGRSPYPHMITVGRTRNNDVVLPDESVSKFHAFFRKPSTDDPSAGPSVLVVQDAGSRNGTYLDGHPVPKTREGEPLPVSAGAQVRFGAVQLTFLDAIGLRTLVLRLK